MAFEPEGILDKLEALGDLENVSEKDETSSIMLMLFESLAENARLYVPEQKGEPSLERQQSSIPIEIIVQSLLSRLEFLIRPQKDEANKEQSAYAKPRLAYRLVTFWYAITWCIVFGLWSSTGIQPETWVMVEFMCTPLAETATLAELLQTLPSKESGPAAVRHYFAYKFIFAIGTCIFYAHYAKNTIFAIIYPVVHCSEAVVIGVGYAYNPTPEIPAYAHLFPSLSILSLCASLRFARQQLLRLRARERLYEKFGAARSHRSMVYLGELGRVLTAQALLIMATGASFLKKRKGNNDSEEDSSFLVELFAATTLAMAASQSFELTVFVRDASSLSIRRLSMFKFTPRESTAFAAIFVFTMVNVLLYMFSGTLTFTEAVTFYWLSLGTYFLATCAVGAVVESTRRGNDRRNANSGEREIEMGAVAARPEPPSTRRTWL